MHEVALWAPLKLYGNTLTRILLDPNSSIIRFASIEIFSIFVILLFTRNKLTRLVSEAKFLIFLTLLNERSRVLRKSRQ